MRKKVIAANWKMNKIPSEAIGFIEQLTPLVKDSSDEIVLCVPYIDLFYTLLYAQGTNIKIGAQNMHWEDSGPCTGEISGQMLKSLGVEYVLLGHSYRRQYFAETDETVNRKLKKAIEVGLKPIVGIGEGYEQKQNGETERVISNQLNQILEGITEEQMSKIILAYEPVWAISTNKNVSITAMLNEDVSCAIKIMRTELSKMYGNSVADSVIIQYGGSVNARNAKELLSIPGVDGGLIGGASLKVEEFAQIINYNK